MLCKKFDQIFSKMAMKNMQVLGIQVVPMMQTKACIM